MEQARNSGLSLQKEYKNAMLEYIGRLRTELNIGPSGVLETAPLFKPLQAKSPVSVTQEDLNASLLKLTVF